MIKVSRCAALPPRHLRLRLFGNRPQARRYPGGDTVYTMGNPLGMGLAVSSGIVSAVERPVTGYSLPCIMNTADISHGSSGGALLNAYGQVLAVTTGAFTYGNNMYLAVPSTRFSPPIHGPARAGP